MQPNIHRFEMTMAQSDKRKRGRPKGSGDRRTAKIAIEAAMKGITPIEVMLENMRWAHESARDLVADINSMVKAGEASRIVRKEGDDEDKFETVFDMYREMIRLKSLAQDCARDAAPYIHPRYTTITVSDDDESPDAHVSVIKRVLVDPKKKG